VRFTRPSEALFGHRPILGGRFQLSDDAAVINAAETRLAAERDDHERNVLRSARILPFHDPEVNARWRRDKT
jgi:hypothetical protein